MTDRRHFLKGVATASAAGVAMVQQAQAAAPAVASAANALSPVDAKAVEAGRLITRPGSDFMVDVIKSLNSPEAINLLNEAARPRKGTVEVGPLQPLPKDEK